MTPQRLLIDTDPGIDDAMALLLALDAPELAVVALTTVFGNAPTATTTQNALALVEMAMRRDVVVARGAEGPLVRPALESAWQFHGRNGLGEVDLGPPRGEAIAQRAAPFLVERIMAEAAGRLVLLALGPLTNLALALRIEPRIAERVARVVVMGGAVTRAGNASAAAEANTRNDPEAAQIVFDAPWPVTLVGLDVTQQTLFTDEQMAWLAALGGAQSTFLHAAHRYYLDAYRRNKALDGFHIHDASALLYLLAPNLFVTRPLHVEVERHSPIHFGMTVADWRYSPAQTPNVEVCVDVQAEPLMRALKKRLARLK